MNEHETHNSLTQPIMNIGIIGLGHMGGAIKKALSLRGAELLSLRGAERRSNLVFRVLGSDSSEKNISVARAADVIFLCVRPAQMADLLKQIRHVLKRNQILISIASKISLKKLSSLSGHKKIVRVMPNLPAHVGEGVSVWKASSLVTKKERAVVRKLLSCFGVEIQVSKELMIDAATAISGSGPAYVAAFLEVLFQTALAHGFSEKDARLLALQTTEGTVEYFEETPAKFSDFIKAVQTKGGTTEAAFKVLKKGRWQEILRKAILAAHQKVKL